MLDDAQARMRWAQIGGGPGVLASALAWLAAGLVELGGATPSVVFGALFAGGLLIVPVSVLAARLAGRGGKAGPLARLGAEAAGVLFAGLFVGFAMLFAAPALTLPLVAVVIGARYLTFETLYGDATYLALGGALFAAGAAATVAPDLLPVSVAFVVAGLEGLFGLFLTVRASRRDVAVPA